MVEMKNNVPSSFIHDFICHEVVTSLRNSLHPPLLPTPNILSRLLHDIAKPEFGQNFDAANAAYRLQMFFLYQFPACNEEGRFYWLQVLTDTPSTDDSSSGPRRGSLLEWNNILSRTAGLRKMILDTFTRGGSNHTLMEFAVSVLEIDLFNMEGCDGLNTSQEILEEDDNCNRTTHSTNDDTLEHLQNSSVLNGVPLSCLVFYDPHERRKRGLDKTAMETCFAIVDNAVSTKSVLCANLCWRLLAVCLEGLRFFLANVNKLCPNKKQFKT
ncbi:unnamed protein product [Cylicostephanus goldi]|uniref:Uncharacterized protein n=1 Tax=Cylicostephanus goldi TaxID=71465 RepID=A0A3P6S8H0_CYLGO|nr:unnamed protein product [Cylicostephanus goldi]